MEFFVAVCGLFIVAHKLLSSCGTRAPEHAVSVVAACGLSSCGVWALECMGSIVVVCGLSSYGVRAQLPRSMWDLSSPTRDQTCVPCIGRWILNHRTTREVPNI